MIIGVTGTHGAGKGAVVDILKNTFDFAHLSVREVLIDEIKRRGLAVNRTSMMNVANDFALENGPEYLALVLYKKASSNGGNVVIESIRRTGEVQVLRRKGDFLLIAVDAQPEIRFERITKRASETDHLSYSQFLDEERREMESDDPTKQNIAGVMKLADHTIMNEGTLIDLENSVIAALHRLRNT